MGRRRDKKGRVLRRGESQRRDGRYAYVWTDNNHKQHFVYSWKLEPGDRIPSGKRDCIALREKEKQIQRDREEGIEFLDGRRTLFEQAKRSIEIKDNIRESTRSEYFYILDKMEKDIFCSREIALIRQSDAKEWIKGLNKKYKYNTVKAFLRVARMAMEDAVRDDAVRNNPFHFRITDVIVNDTKEKQPWTPEQRDAFLEFCKEEKYAKLRVDGFYVLFHTGIRISEFCGLTLEDIDLEKNIIYINKQLIKSRRGTLYIEKTKTRAGTRVLPITQETAACFRRMIEKRKKEPRGPSIDGVDGFLYLTELGTPAVNGNWGSYLQRARKSYNACHEEKLPPISPHICRHTYCSIMAAFGMNPKVLQYLMGHGDIKITMDIYTHMDAVNSRRELERLKEVYRSSI